ncbi:MAG: hypothetical protein WC758_03385 [Candidatus Woesearchaeota archaeon]|jgi:hypothetical protein
MSVDDFVQEQYLPQSVWEAREKQQYSEEQIQRHKELELQNRLQFEQTNRRFKYNMFGGIDKILASYRRYESKLFDIVSSFSKESEQIPIPALRPVYMNEHYIRQMPNSGRYK